MVALGGPITMHFTQDMAAIGPGLLLPALSTSLRLGCGDAGHLVDSVEAAAPFHVFSILYHID